MADVNSILRRYKQSVEDIGRASLHALYPRDFEYYSISLELTTHDGKTVDYFIFPVMPSNITKSENARVNIKKTLTSTIVTQNKSFIPHNITIKGDFGRSFKILLQPNKPIDFTALRFSMSQQVNNVFEMDVDGVKQVINEYNPAIKTGYGAIKILQSMVDKSKGVDEKGNPFKLYLYNPALGESYLVVPTTNPLSLQQNDQQMNMIWGYTLNLTILANVTSFKNNSKNSLSNLVSVHSVQKLVNKSAKDITNFLGRVR